MTKHNKNTTKCPEGKNPILQIYFIGNGASSGLAGNYKHRNVNKVGVKGLFSGV